MGTKIFTANKKKREKITTLEKPIRAFFAIPLDKKTQKALSKYLTLLTKTSEAKNVRWIKKENLHITLKFLGNIQYDDCLELGKRVGAASQSFSPFTIKLTGLTLLPSPIHPRVVAISTEESPELKKVFNTLEKNARGYGVPKEHRRFQPHLTIGRVRRNKKYPLNSEIEFPVRELLVDNVTLFQSIPDAKGVSYAALNIIKFGESRVARE